MSANQKSSLVGELKDGAIVTPLDMQSTKGESRSILDTLESTASQRSQNTSQDTMKSPDDDSPNTPNSEYFRLIAAFAAKLGKLVEWKRLELGNGETVYALCFSVRKWRVVTDGVRKGELEPLKELGK